MTGKRAGVVTILGALLMAGPLGSAAADDWPQWRGPNRDGVVRDLPAPKSWPGEPTMEWKVQVGLGHSSPLVAGGRIYVQTREGGEEVLRSLRPGSGETIWRQAHSAPYVMNSAAERHGKGPKATPVLSDGIICALAINGTLSCHDAVTGALKWRNDFSGRFERTSPKFGAAMSPLIDRGTLLAHVGGHGSGALIAFDVETGEIEWSWDGDGPGYASPIIVTFDGVRQAVTQSQEHLVGVAMATGRLLWSVPFETPYVQNIVTPVVHGDALIFSGLEKGTLALRPRRKGESWSIENIWTNETISLYMSSPVLAGDRLCGLSHLRKGQFFCLDAGTGKVLWVSEGRNGDQAASFAAGDLLFHLTDQAELVVARAGAKSWDPIARYTMAPTPTWAHPVPIDGDILIKDESTLARWSLREAAPGAKPKKN